MQNLTIRSIATHDLERIAAIYNHYIRHTAISFEEVEVTIEQLAERVDAVTSSSLPWLVAELSGQVVGYAYAGKFHQRSAYRFTVEATVYLAHGMPGNGIGTQLYSELFAQLKRQDIHSIIGIIALPNQPSIALHEKFGFRKIGHFPEVGFKFNAWQDVGYWQLVLAR
jgi:L-amino acid N-acyltransferase YncA